MDGGRGRGSVVYLYVDLAGKFVSYGFRNRPSISTPSPSQLTRFWGNYTTRGASIVEESSLTGVSHGEISSRIQYLRNP